MLELMLLVYVGGMVILGGTRGWPTQLSGWFILIIWPIVVMMECLAFVWACTKQ